MKLTASSVAVIIGSIGARAAVSLISQCRFAPSRFITTNPVRAVLRCLSSEKTMWFGVIVRSSIAIRWAFLILPRTVTVSVATS